jgi:DNA anti-recombination protein RmuC
MKNLMPKSRMLSKQTRVAPALLVAVLSASVACQKTAEGIKEDTRALATNAGKTADEAKSTLEVEVNSFKAEANAKLEELSVQVAALESKATNGLNASKQKLEGEIAETRAKLAELKADSRVEWQETKRELDNRLAELGKEMNQALDTAGDKVEKTLD